MLASHAAGSIDSIELPRIGRLQICFPKRVADLDRSKADGRLNSHTYILVTDLTLSAHTATSTQAGTTRASEHHVATVAGARGALSALLDRLQTVSALMLRSIDPHTSYTTILPAPTPEHV